MALHWYVLRSKPGNEDYLYRIVRAREVECYYPRIRADVDNNQQAGPFFPGCMFVHADLTREGKNRFRWLPFSLGLIHLGGVPVEVPENLVSSVQRSLAEINQPGDTQDSIAFGGKMNCVEGPFSAYLGLVDGSLPGRDRVQLLRNMLQNSIEHLGGNQPLQFCIPA